MKILKFFSEKIIQSVSAVEVNTLEDLPMPACYIAPPPPVEIASNIVKIAFFVIIAPVTAFFTAIKHARILSKRKSFSLFGAIYKAFRRILILSIIFIILNSILPLVIGIGWITGSYGNDRRIEIEQLQNEVGFIVIFLLIIMSVATGIGFVFFARKDLKFLKLALAFILVIPAILISLIAILAIPAMLIFPTVLVIPAILISLIVLVLIGFLFFRKYTPRDDIELKKEQLKQTLIQEGKIPFDKKE